MLHYEQEFGNIFERMGSKCGGVLMKHCREVIGEQVITLQMAQQLKTKNISVVPGQLFCRQCKAKFLLETETHYIDDQDKVQSVTDTDNEFNECQTPRKKAPINSHFTCQCTRFYEHYKERYFRGIQSQVDCLEDLESDSYDKNDMKEKANNLVRLHEAMQEKLKTASYSAQIQILTLVADKWSRMYCSENLMSLNTLYEFHIKSKK